MTVGNWFAKLASAYSGIQGENQRAGELLRRGAEHQNAGNSGAAEECYRQLLSLQPENAEARHRLARILAATGSASQERGELGAAIEGYEEALALEQGQADVLNNLGNVYRDLGRLADAIAAFRNAIDVDGGRAEAHFNLGTALFQSGENAQAIAQCRTALALRASFPEASMSLGYLLEREGDAPVHGAAASVGDGSGRRRQTDDEERGRRRGSGALTEHVDEHGHREERAARAHEPEGEANRDPERQREQSVRHGAAGYATWPAAAASRDASQAPRPPVSTTASIPCRARRLAAIDAR